MGEINVVITAETAEVRDDTLVGFHTIVVKSPALPLGKAKGNLELGILKVSRSKRGRALHTIQVIVKSRTLGNKERARNTLKVDVGLELVFKGLLDEAERFFLDKEFLELGLVGLHDLLGRKSGKGVFGVKRSSHGQESMLGKGKRRQVIVWR